MSKTLKKEQDFGQVYSTRGGFLGGANIAKARELEGAWHTLRTVTS